LVLRIADESKCEAVKHSLSQKLEEALGCKAFSITYRTVGPATSVSAGELISELEKAVQDAA
jgi:hypothetical protein